MILAAATAFALMVTRRIEPGLRVRQLPELQPVRRGGAGPGLRPEYPMGLRAR